MKFGVSMFATDRSATPAEVALLAEQIGFDAFWVSEHSHMPLTTDFPLADEVPREYAAMLDPFVALAAAATVTSSIRIGTAICILPQHDPINCAKAVASLDHLSGGRMVFGVGAGWNAPEMQNHGSRLADRFKIMRERVEAMRVLWDNEVAEYHGEFVDFDPAWQWPKPIQPGGPPVLIAGAHPNVLKRVARYGDGWLPVVIPEANSMSENRMTPIDDFERQVVELRSLCADTGRAPPVIVASSADMSEPTLDRLRTLEIDSVTCRLSSADFATVQRELEGFAPLVS
ncbi:MAG: LLM class F420-dependent oxidoreductase [Pseudomonadaceae bacterium]|nr:LLM class F420-dependent oxidoreductase [Pseudomonadaceae bacterium]